MEWTIQSKNSLVFQCAVVADFVISEIYVGPKVLFPTDIKIHFCDSITSSQFLKEGSVAPWCNASKIVINVETGPK